MVDELGEPVPGLSVSAKENESQSSAELFGGYTESNGLFCNLGERDGSQLRVTLTQREKNKEPIIKSYLISPETGKKNCYKIVWKMLKEAPYNAAEKDAEGRLVSELGFALKEQDKGREVWSTKLEYTEQFDRLESLLKESDVIVIAEVTGIDAAESKGVVFTCYDVDVKRLLKNSCNYDLSDMKIQMTGGKTEKVEEIVEETPVLEIGKTYLFAGDKTFPDDTSKKEFTPSGAYQGVFELESTTEAYSRKNNDYKIRLMNPYNAVERGAEGTTIPEIEEILKNIK